MLAILVPAVAIVSASLILSVIKLMPLRNKTNNIQPIVLDSLTTKVLDINDIKYNFSYYPDRAGILNSAVSFCSDNGDHLGLSMSTIKNCVQSITRAIHKSHAQNDKDEYTPEELKGFVTVSGFPSPRRMTILKIMDGGRPPAVHDNPSDHQVDISDISELSSHDTVEALIETLNKDVPTNHQSVNIEVNGLTYIFDFPPLSSMSRDRAAEQLAIQFCSIHRAALNLETAEETVVKNRCIVPLTEALIAEINKTDVHS